MTWSSLPFKPGNKTLRQFAGIWLVLFLAGGIYQFIEKDRRVLGLIMCSAAVIVGPLGLIKPAAVRWLFVSCMVLAFPMGWAISQLALGVIFYLVLTPVAFIFRLRRRDLLCRKPAPGQTTFWEPKNVSSDVRSYFRQY